MIGSLALGLDAKRQADQLHASIARLEGEVLDAEERIADLEAQVSEAADLRRDQAARIESLSERSRIHARVLAKKVGADPDEVQGESQVEGKRLRAARWKGVQQVGETIWTLEKATVERAVAEQGRLSREFRAVPHYMNGAPKGWKIFSLRRTSLARKLGWRNNDVLVAVDGEDLSSTEDPGAIFSMLLERGSIRLDLLRGGESQMHEYSVD